MSKFTKSKFAKKVRKVSPKIKIKKSNGKATKTETEMGEVEVPEMGEVEVLYITPDIYIPETNTYIQPPKDVPMQEEIEEIESTQVVDYYKCPLIDCVQKTKWANGKNKKWSEKGMFCSPKAKIVKIHLCVSHDIPEKAQKQFWGFSPIPVYKQNSLQ